MEAIKRQIYVLRDALKDEIVYSLGTDLVPIEYHIMDFTVPATATAVVYVLKPSGKLDKKLADVLDNTISFAPHIGFFEEGKNQIQIRIVDKEKALVSFTETVRTEESMKFDDAAEAQQKTLIEQVLTKAGECTGAVKTEIADRKAAVTKEETDRKSEDMAIRKEVTSLKTKNEEDVKRLESLITAKCSDRKAAVTKEETDRKSEDMAIRKEVTSLKTKNEEDVKRLESLITAKCSAISMGGYGNEWQLTQEWKQIGNYIPGEETDYYKNVQGSEGYIEIKQNGVYLLIMQAEWQLTQEWKQIGNYIPGEETDYYKNVQGSEGYIEIKQNGVYLLIMQASVHKKTSETSGVIWSEIRASEHDLGGDTHFMPTGAYYDTLKFVTYQYLTAGARLKLYIGVDQALTGVYSVGKEYLNIIRL